MSSHKLNFWEDPPEFFARLAKTRDADVDLAQTAIMLAAEQHPGLVIERYGHHIDKMSKRVSAAHALFISEGAQDDVDTQMAVLKQVMYTENGYTGDSDNYDNLDNADLIRVIDRRKGLPVALGIIYITLATRQGWQAEGINFPGHFYIRITKVGHQRLIDPFDQGNPVQASDIRQKLKHVQGAHAELSSSFYESVGKRTVLIRLQNNIKMRQIAAEDYEGALKTVKRMQLIDPKEPRLYYDSGILHAKLQQPQAAISALETYLDAPDLSSLDKEEAYTLIEQIKSILQ